MLQELYSAEAERCGLILGDGTMVELKNVSEEPSTTFSFDPEEFEEYTDVMASTWHTHTHADPNLSFDDYQFFLAWPLLDHFIISSKAVWYYEVVNGSVIVDNEANNYTSRAPAR